MQIVHDSNNLKYRRPLGGGPCGGVVSLGVECPSDANVSLRLWWRDAEQIVEMKPEAQARGDTNPAENGHFTCDITLPDTPGVMWYFFIIETGEGTVYYGNASDRLDGVGLMCPTEPPGYQITIYDPDYRTPEWMRDTIIYQIMADRFYASKPLDERPRPYMGWLHADWYDEVALSKGEACDFFGGDLKGIEMKLPYLKSIGVGAIYLNPIFRARSNHKYDTGDYMCIDPMFGSEDDFKSLCRASREMGIRVLIDGVFSHTGAVSRYFNRDGSYPDVGAFQSPDSIYHDWYKFKRWPDDYDCWWGFRNLPNTNEMQPGFVEFIIDGEDSVSAHWINAGASGWRLDVADELPMDFIRRLRKRVKSISPDAAVLGEVWEDASNKLSYGEMRCYCLGDTLDSVMNYPLRDMSIAFMLGDIDSVKFQRRYTHMKNTYSPQFFYSLMNLLGSHDKPRIIDVLSGAVDTEPPREKRRHRRLSPERYALGRERYIALWRFICSLPGMPHVYYADEAGMTGMTDPFCRATYPWGREDSELISAIASVNHQRNSLPVLRRGEARIYAPDANVLVCARYIQNGLDAFGQPARDDVRLCCLNRSDRPISVILGPDDVLPTGFTATIAPRSGIMLPAE